MSGHQLGSANGSATLWRGRRWRLLRCRADIAPGFSAPSGREGHHLAHPARLGHPNGQRQDPQAAAPQLADPVRHVGHRGEALASLGPAGPRAPTPMLVTVRPRRPGVEELMPTCREERDPAAVAACVGDQVAQRPRRPTCHPPPAIAGRTRGREGLLTGPGRPRPAGCRGPADAESPTSRSPRWSICTPKTPPVRAREDSHEHPA